MIRKIRAILIIAALWAALWAPAGIAAAIYEGIQSSPHGPAMTPVLPALIYFPISFAFWGAIAGAVFAILLILTERGSGLANLSLPRFTVWGAIGSIALPLALAVFGRMNGPLSPGFDDWQLLLVEVAVSAVLGAVCAAGTLAIMRRPSK